MKRTISVYADVQVEVDLRKFSTDELMEEIKDRGEMLVHKRLLEISMKNDEVIHDADDPNQHVYIPRLNSKEQHPLHGVYYALKFGKKDHAVDLMRGYLADLFGVCL